jgi:hypothetical protein
MAKRAICMRWRNNQMKARWIALLILVTACLLAVPTAAFARAFTVGPPTVSVTVPAGGKAVSSVYITSDFDGELVVGTEDIPFRVEPETITVDSSYVQQEVQLTFYGNPSVPDGTYAGKVTFLAYSGNNVAHGVKIRADVSQVGQFHPGGEGDGGGNSFMDWIGDNYVVVALSALVVIALVVGIIIGRMRRYEF